MVSRDINKVVVKSWKVSETPIDGQDYCVEIIGRKPGFFAWLSALFGIDPTVRLRVGSKWFEYKKASLAGWETKQIPLRKVSSVFNSYYRPWKKALAVFLSLFVTGGMLIVRMGEMDNDFIVAGLITMLVGAVIALLYFFLNRSFVLCIYEVGGRATGGIRFKRSVIENVDINQAKVEEACQIIKRLIEAENR